MKKMIFMFALVFIPFVWSDTQLNEFYMGEIKCHYATEEYPVPFGFFLMKRSFSPEGNSITDSCTLISQEDGTFHFKHVSFLQDDSNKFLALSPDSALTGEGELVGFPWHWTEFHEHLELNSNSGVMLDVQNKRLKNGGILSSADLYFEGEEDEEQQFFARFSTHLYPVDPKIIESLLEVNLDLGSEVVELTSIR